MVSMNRRNFLALATMMLGSGRLPNVLPDVPLDSDDVKIAEWVKTGKNKSVEDKYKMDEKGNEHRIGSVAHYDREVVIDGNKWCITYADSGPISQETKLFSSDETPNRYDRLRYELCNKPHSQRTPREMLEFVNRGLDGILYHGEIGMERFLNPNSPEFKERIQIFDSYQGLYKDQREQDKRRFIDSNLRLFLEGLRRYEALKQQILRAIH